MTIIKNIKGPEESLITTISFCSQLTFDLILFYRPPGERRLDNLVEIINRDSKTPTVTLGDFNLPDIDWSHSPGSVKETS